MILFLEQKNPSTDTGNFSKRKFFLNLTSQNQGLQLQSYLEIKHRPGIVVHQFLSPPF